jgi:sulfoxide reductase heme-binding subunit YedZ
MASPSSRRAGKSPLVAVGLLPVAWLIVGFYRDELGANPIEKITHVTGDWALRFLLVSLAVTPLRRLLGWNGLIAYRRMLGLFAFFYAVLHLTTFTVLDHFFDWQEMIADVYKRPYVTAGMTAFVCLLPLALTSTRGWIRRLGSRWTQLHRLAYVAAAAAVLHYWWLVKADVRAPFWYAAVLATLFAVRLVYRLTATRAAAASKQSGALRTAGGPVGETPGH